ncbi:MAG TPA: GNAT family N-acetyltransferase [Rhabdochlamydiaceae bacterium]|nr:GNAT family N-acetyltransferase [Rhabdochlamydiaceae bacterium]
MFIETARLEIREWTNDDFEEFVALMSDPEVMRFSLMGRPLNLDEAKEYFQKRILDHSQHGFGLWAIYTQVNSKFGCQVGSKHRKSIPAKRVVLANTSPLCRNRFSLAFNPAWQPNFEFTWVYYKEEKKIIGLAGLIIQEIEGTKKIELGYRLLPKYWHRGLALEAAREICTYAFTVLKLKELISIIEPANTRSIRLAERVGMRPQEMIQFHDRDVYIYVRAS